MGKQIEEEAKVQNTQKTTINVFAKLADAQIITQKKKPAPKRIKWKTYDRLRDVRIEGPDDARIDYYAKFLTQAESKQLFDYLNTTCVWKQGVFKIFGRQIPTPRLHYFFYGQEVADADPSILQKWPGRVWSPEMLALKNRIEYSLNIRINYCLVNLYRDGNDHVDWHSDDENHEGNWIASVSIGEVRKFRLRHKEYQKNGLDGYEFSLNDGSLIIFNNSAGNTHYKHSIQKDPKITKPRINITFRIK